MKTRKNKSQHGECLKKLQDMCQSKKTLLDLIGHLIKKEKIKKVQINLQAIEFEIKLTNSKIERQKLEQKYREIISNYERLDKPPKNLHIRDANEIKQEDDKKQNHPELSKLTSSINDGSTQATPSASSAFALKSIKNRDKKTSIAGSNLKSLANLSSSDRDFERKEKERRDKEDKELAKYFKYRVRKNRIGKLVIDRYIQNSSSMSPFDDSFNDILLLETSQIRSNQLKESKLFKSNFEETYHSYLNQVYLDYPNFSDEDEEIDENAPDVRYLSQTYKSYLKQKRAINE